MDSDSAGSSNSLEGEPKEPRTGSGLFPSVKPASCFSLTPSEPVSPPGAGRGAEALGPHEVVGVASLPAELAVQHSAVLVGRSCEGQGHVGSVLDQITDQTPRLLTGLTGLGFVHVYVPSSSVLVVCGRLGRFHRFCDGRRRRSPVGPVHFLRSGRLLRNQQGRAVHLEDGTGETEPSEFVVLLNPAGSDSSALPPADLNVLNI